MKVLITNSVVLNGGEAGTVTALVDLFKRVFGDQVECIVYDQHADTAARYYPELTFRELLYYRASLGRRLPIVGALVSAVNRARFMLGARLWALGRHQLAAMITTPQERGDLEHYSSADLIISTGGTYLVDNYDLAPRCFDYDVALLLERPLVFFTQSIGPLTKPENRERLRPILERASLILLRDERSLGCLRGLGVKNPNVSLSADSVFAMGAGSMEATRSRTRRLREPTSSGRPRAAISVRHWLHFKTIDVTRGMAQYRRAIAAAATSLVTRHGFDVTFVSSCQGVREYWADDSATAVEIAESLDADVRRHVSVDRSFRGPAEMIQELEQYDFVVATRFHMAVFALLAGTPALAIAYEFKTQELYKLLGAGPEWALDMEGLDAASLCAALEQALPVRESMMERFARAVQVEQDRALQAGELLARVVTGRAERIRREPAPEPELVA
jgi:colanic acid/amylovoran biosynthesis protein